MYNAKVMPLIVQSIATEDEGLLSSTLKTVGMLVKEAPDVVSDHLSAFIPALLRLTTFRSKMVPVSLQIVVKEELTFCFYPGRASESLLWIVCLHSSICPSIRSSHIRKRVLLDFTSSFPPQGGRPSIVVFAVTNELVKALDDPKRAVRRSAVKCRSQWFSSLQIAVHNTH